MLMPWDILKVLGVLSLIGFHIVLAVTVRVNDAPFINMSVLLAFLPGRFWDLLQAAWMRVSISYPRMQPWSVLRELAKTLHRLGLATPTRSSTKTAVVELQKSVPWATRMMLICHRQSGRCMTAL